MKTKKTATRPWVVEKISLDDSSSLLQVSPDGIRFSILLIPVKTFISIVSNSRKVEIDNEENG